MSGYVVGIGAANFDVCGRSRMPIVMRDSNPGSIVTSCGGVTRNVLENLARLGASTHLITALGDDAYGDRLTKSCRELGIDCSRSLTVPGHVSSSYISVLDESGDMLVAISDMSILEYLSDQHMDSHREFVQGAQVIVCDPSLPSRALDFITSSLAGEVPVFADPVSTSYARKLLPFVGSCHTVKPNSMELEAMTGIHPDSPDNIRRACDRLLETGVQRVVVSLGAGGCASATRDGRFILRSLRPVTYMKNATGAGDSLMAGLVQGFCLGLPEEQALDYGLACGIAAIISESTINPDLSPELIAKILEEYRIDG